MTSIALRMPPSQLERLDRFAGGLHKGRDEAAAQLIEEALRHEEFPAVEFRDSIAGRQVYAVGSGLAVWEVVMIAEGYGLDPCQTAAHLGWHESLVNDVLRYFSDYPDEIQSALAENRAMKEEDLRTILPPGRWIDTR